MDDNKCKGCKFSEDLKGCAQKHVSEARKLISEGDSRGADNQLSALEKHLRK
jgi:hypothetical protein